MSPNLILAVVTSGFGLVTIVCVARGRSAGLPSVVLGTLFWVVGVFGHPLWQWSRFSEGAGLPAFISSEAMAQSAAVPAFLFASIGAFASVYLLPGPNMTMGSEGAQSDSVRTGGGKRRSASAGAFRGATTSGAGSAGERALERRTRDSHLLAVVGFSLLLYSLWCIGEGPSLLRREIYLATDGNEFVLRLTWPASLIVALVVLVVGYVSTSMTVRVAALGMSLIWYLSLLSVGTRMSCTFPLILGVLVLYRALAPARYGLSRIRPGGVLGAALLLVLAVASFGVIRTARVNPHGLLNLTSLFTEVAQSQDGLSEPLKQLVSSIAASYPIVEQSMNMHVDSSILFGNANPLPGTANPADLERLWPYEWVPLAFVGTWYAATGPIGQIALFGLMAWIPGQLFANLKRGRWGSAAYMAVGFAILLGILSIQYSSRMPWRILSVVVVLMVIAYLVREHRPAATWETRSFLRPLPSRNSWTGSPSPVGYNHRGHSGSAGVGAQLRTHDI